MAARPLYGWWPDPTPTLERCQHCGRAAEHLTGDACGQCRERGHAGCWRECETCRIEAFTLRERIEDALSWAEGCRP